MERGGARGPGPTIVPLYLDPKKSLFRGLSSNTVSLLSQSADFDRGLEEVELLSVELRRGTRAAERQIGRLGTAEAEESSTNQEIKMQAAAFKNKKRRSPANEGADDPAYENITFKTQHQPKGGHSPPENKAQSKPASDPAQVPHWLPKAMMSLYVLLALSLLLIILSALVLVKNSEMSQELLVLRSELHNVSLSVGECQDKERKRWNDVKQGIDTVTSKVHEGNQKLRTLATVSSINEIKTTLQEILQMLKMPNPKLVPTDMRMDPKTSGHVRMDICVSLRQGRTDTRAPGRPLSGITERAPPVPPRRLRTPGLLRRRKATRPNRLPQVPPRVQAYPVSRLAVSG
ncbi:PREDICTED: mast cell-expressed membrane protein 1 [Lipotes vexillifer]|uniref:Mast cell-expressed membrane protein 1 n=1 Tax=Lipotes vexillifer TaxID=118797 RepID=A0A340XH70_LIPVE|nr:PREDICTED: mast cell-expressed membrane protein 1 [Lipotes vexillifer]